MEEEERNSANDFANNSKELYSKLKPLSQYKYKGDQNNLLQEIKRQNVGGFTSRKLSELSNVGSKDTDFTKT